MQTVAAGDGLRKSGNALTRYYTQAGTPPGRWLGAGLAGLNRGKGVEPGSQVSEEQLFHLLGMGADPVTGESLGRAPNRARPGYKDRVTSRLRALPAGVDGAEHGRRLEQIRSEERAREAEAVRNAVAGFDLTFSVPKSVSAVWGIADAPTQAKIVDAHYRAIDEALAYAEREIFATRIGVNGIAQAPVRGVVAAAFDHWDSRASDPHLHTHVVVANRVQAVDDDKWRTLDSRALYRAVVALSELHQGLVMDRVSDLLGVGWDARGRRHSAVPLYEIVGVPDEMRAEFSRRSASIEGEKNRLVSDYRRRHGRDPSARAVLQLRQQATLATRPDKDLQSLAELTDQWRERARPYVGFDTAAWVRRLPRPHTAPYRSSDFTTGAVQEFAERALGMVAEKRATFSRWNVAAQVHRQLQPFQFATATERHKIGERTTDSALGLSVLLSTPDLADTPARFRRGDGTSQFRHRGAERYTTQAILDAEDSLLAAGRDTSGPRVSQRIMAAVPGDRHRMSGEQADSVAQIATSGRTLDVLLGAAGTGKTSAMAGLLTAWQAEHGPGSVIGLAPSATAADVLGIELGIATENTAKWITEMRREPDRLARLRVMMHWPGQTRGLVGAVNAIQEEVDRWRIKPGQLVIVDEASLASTLTLDALVTAARDAGAKLLLVGDWAQLSSVDAGGGFGLLVRDRAPAPELLDIHRFTQRWEKTASLQIRAGDPAVIDAYQRHGRIHEGGQAAMLDQAYGAWLADTRSGRRSLLIASDTDTVTELNARAHAELVAAGSVTGHGVPLADGTSASAGDCITTRRNDRLLSTGIGWVKNGDQWRVLRANPNGSLTVRRLGAPATVLLPAGYVSEHVELGYATTAHRAQGQTVDTAHAIVTGPGMIRQALYVAMTRGAAANHVYVATDYDIDPDTAHGPAEPQTSRTVLTAVLNNVGGDLSAHETIRAEQETAAGWPQLTAEYETIASTAQHDHWWSLINASLPAEKGSQIADSPALSALMTALRRADAYGLDVQHTFPRLVHARELHTAEDAAAVLHERVERWITATTSGRPPRATRLIAGLHPVAHVADPEAQRALDERAALLEDRARTLTTAALKEPQGWARRLGAIPRSPARRQAFLRAATTIAAYRDRWNITTTHPLGPAALTDIAYTADRATATQALLTARRIAAAERHVALSVPISTTPEILDERER